MSFIYSDMYTSVHVCRTRDQAPPKKPKKVERKKRNFPWKSILRFSSPLIPPQWVGFPKSRPR